MKTKNPPLWLWDIIGIGFLILGILGICKYGISKRGVFYVGYTVLGTSYLILSLIRFKTKVNRNSKRKNK